MPSKTYKQLTAEVLMMLESAELAQFRSYTYYQPYFMESTRVVSWLEVHKPSKGTGT